MTTLSLRWTGVIIASAVLATGGLITLHVTEARPFTDEAEPVACRNLSSGQNLPAGKLEVLRGECEAARAAAARSPVPIVTPVPQTPGPVVPCDEWDPATGGGCLFYGILEGRQPPPGYEKRIHVSNAWAGSDRLVYAGSLYDDKAQGVVVVVERFGSNSPLGEYRPAARDGALRIVSADGKVLRLASNGTEYTFDVEAMLLTPK
jgi:hypothetical protein